MNKTKIIIGVLVVAAVVAWYAFRNTTKAPETVATPTPTATPTETPTATTSVVPTVSVVDTVTTKEFTISGKPFSFTPSTITVNKGDKVKITFVNQEGFHDLKIDEFKAATKQIKAGAQETIEFVADKAGSFEYYCSVGNHRAMGMKGTLVVK